MTPVIAPLLAVLTAASGILGAPAQPTAPERGVWPLQPRPVVVAQFDPPLTRYGRGHRGVDLAGTPGEEVHAAARGRVTYAGSLAGRGVVVLTHGATRTTYEPVHAGVEVGALVSAGEVIGTLESVGSHCPPAACLHWGLIQGDTYLDPLTLVGGGPVRLLALSGPAPVLAPVERGLGSVAPRGSGERTTGLAPSGPRLTAARVSEGWSPIRPLLFPVLLRPGGGPVGRPDGGGRW